MVGKPTGRSIALLLTESLPQLRALRRLLACLVCAGALFGALQVSVALHADASVEAQTGMAALTAQPGRR